MKLSRMTWLLLGLAATAALAAFGETPTQHEPTVAAAAPLPSIRSLAPRQPLPAGSGDPFALVSPPPEPQVASPAAILPAPTFSAALAWRVIGKLQEEGAGWTVFLANGGATRVVRVGDTLDEAYRVAVIDPPKMTLQHVRQKNRLTLDIGEAKE